ncbi:hypothetical protein IFM89_026287 [Coptis chinensis]|uniref:HMA domain-containing protein n=1 Tax=Coptis chinensis TaxID=261450 RepID=A0A835IZX7_9MAGN|nr:hypothetical protein IFM89_026287 [Coptis chinensis]
MATATTFPSLYSSSSFCMLNTHPISFLRLKTRNNNKCLTNKRLGKLHTRIIKAVAEEEEQQQVQVEKEALVSEQPVSVPVSPSDILTMFFQAEGAMDESIVPRVTKALEEVEGISDVNVRVLEGIASVELKKQTTVQATGVASNLVEVIQGSGFKLQTLNLSFEDEEDIA